MIQKKTDQLANLCEARGLDVVEHTMATYPDGRGGSSNRGVA